MQTSAAMARYTEIPRSVLEMLPESLDVDNQIRVIYFLATSIHNGTADPFLSALESVIANQQVFQGVAQRFADDTRLVEIDPDYRQFMQDIWTNYLREDNLPPDRDGQEFDFNAHQLSIMPASQYNFLLAVSRMPAKNYEALIATIKSVGGAGRLAVWAEHSLTSARKLLPVVCYFTQEVAKFHTTSLAIHFLSKLYPSSHLSLFKDRAE